MKPHSKHVLSLLLLSISTLQAFAGVAEFPFSVSPDRQILFSSGNLQYNAAQGTHTCADGSTLPGTWRFAEHQWDFVGDSEYGNVYQNGVKCNNSLISESYDGWIDLFGWGTSGWNSGANAYQPWATSASYSDFYPGGNYTNNLTGDFAYADWGQYNAVGDDPAGTWRTLTKDEWAYLIQTRPNANSKYGAAKVNGWMGVVILPDDFTLPSGCLFTAGMTSATKGNDWSSVASTNIYTAAQWQQMEAAGAVFLPCAGRREKARINFVGTYGGYWSSTADNENDTYGLGFESNVLYWRNGIRNHGYSVRLVKDVPLPPPPSAYEPMPFSVAADKQILFSSGNLQYNAAQGTHQCADGTTLPGTWRFAEHQYDYVGDAEYGNVYQNGVKCDNALISDTYDGWIDLFGWGASGWNSGANAYQPYATSDTNSDYYPDGNEPNDLTGDYAYADWAVYNQIGSDPADTWRTLTKDEWEYLFHERTNAEQLFGMATVNGVQGTILLPDDWISPDNVTFNASTDKGLEWNGTYYESSTKDIYSHNSYTALQWVTMEAAGAVFLPAGGGRSGTTTVNYASESGNYWTTSHNSAEQAFRMRFYIHYLYPSYHSWLNYGRSVRPVRPVIPECTTETSEFTQTICDGETYTWEGTDYKEHGDHTLTLKTTQGCDSIVTLHLIVHDVYHTTDEEAFVCFGKPFFWNGVPYTESGEYTQRLQSVNHCDSIVTRRITILQKSESHEYKTIFAGSTYEWNGAPYDKTGDYPFQTTDSHDCDSTAWLHLTVTDKPFVTRDSVVELCEGEVFDFYGERFAQSALASVSRPGETTDTVVTLRLTVWPTYAVELTDTVLSGQTLTLNAESFAEEGDHVLRLESTHHCDSILTLHLVVNSVELTGVQANAQCAGEQTVELEIAHTGTVHEVQLSFDEEARRAGWQDITLPMPEHGFISLPATARAGDYMLTLQLLFRGQTVATHTVPVRLLYPASVMEQAWNDVIAVLTRDYNGGYDFVAFQWYENGQPLNGETRSYLYRPLVMGAEYSALLTEQDGTQSMTCPLIATPQTDVTLYPTIATPNQLIHCHLSQAAVITVYDALGRKLTTASLAAGDNTFPAPPAKGVYLIRICTSASDTAQTCKLIIR